MSSMSTTKFVRSRLTTDALNRCRAGPMLPRQRRSRAGNLMFQMRSTTSRLIAMLMRRGGCEPSPNAAGPLSVLRSPTVIQPSLVWSSTLRLSVSRTSAGLTYGSGSGATSTSGFVQLHVAKVTPVGVDTRPGRPGIVRDIDSPSPGRYRPRPTRLCAAFVLPHVPVSLPL